MNPDLLDEQNVQHENPVPYKWYDYPVVGLLYIIVPVVRVVRWMIKLIK